jgi:pyruvate dehydrogenase (quinone)
MSQTVSDYVWSRLHEWGISRVFGYPGDGAGGLDVALERAKGFMHYVQVRHEEMAAFMASGHAKFTGEVGLCYATSGPGATHLLTGLYDAKCDHQPVVAICGQQARFSLGTHFQQELDLQTLFSDVSEYVVTATVPGQVRMCIDRAVRIAQAKRAVCTVIIPNDLQLMAYEELPTEHGASHTGIGFPGTAKVPDADALRHAAAILNEGSKVAMLVGAGALGATDEVIAVADALGAGCAKALLGKAVLPDDLPWATGHLGLLGTKPSWDMMKGCDTFLMVGSSFPYAEFLPEPGQARGVQIDIDGANLSLRYPMEYSLQGDAKATLAALLPLLTHKADRSWRDEIASGLEGWHKTVAARAMVPAKPINPQRIFHELSPLLPDDVIMTGDSGSVANWYARDIAMRRGMMGSLSGSLASLGAATPYAIAAKFAHPHRPVIGFIGDGAMQMNGLNEMITVGKYWRSWGDPRFILMVLNNQDLNQVTWEERIQIGAGKTESTQDIPDFPYARYAELLNLKGIYCDDPERIADAWREALASDRPVILEFRADPDVPPLPPHITLEEARHFMTMTASEPNLGSVIANSARQLFARVLPSGN